MYFTASQQGGLFLLEIFHRLLLGKKFIVVDWQPSAALRVKRRSALGEVEPCNGERERKFCLAVFMISGNSMHFALFDGDGRAVFSWLEMGNVFSLMCVYKLWLCYQLFSRNFEALRVWIKICSLLSSFKQRVLC